MKEYIKNKTKNTTKHFKFGNISVEEIDPLPDSINIDSIFKAIETNLPSHYFKDLKSVKIGDFDVFEDRDINALYKDQTLFITNKQDGPEDLLDDIVHEIAHHVETIMPQEVYGNESVINEFLRKRYELKFELQSEGYWVNEHNFDNLKYDNNFDIFLYKRVGKNLMRMLTTGLFIRPYAAISLREYFATGFEAYYLGKQDILEKISPMLYDKINELHNYSSY
jgi:hypothetical protein